MAKQTQTCLSPRVPLTPADREALDKLFQGVQLEDLRQLEEIKSYYSTAPLEPWEEQGWLTNSSLPSPREATA
ncbi:MAG: hypothetical protein RID09_13910 [Coleofasciculus sp. G1-WW12-02]|uniref:hypothetical protein n=1 Tax=Coleofasciculus sp. G1-WW12-02 TaxID=3068483 RepID=UPI00330008CA